MKRKLKMWVGNLDGERQGAVIATSKIRARAIIRTNPADFDGYWVEQPQVDPSLEPETLYTRIPTHTRVESPWFKGRCPGRRSL